MESRRCRSSARISNPTAVCGDGGELDLFDIVLLDGITDDDRIAAALARGISLS